MLPVKFKERMERLLGEQSSAFFEAIETREAVRSFRVNEIKCLVQHFEALDVKIDKRKASFPSDAYYTEEQFPGRLPCHHSGMIYMQDPAAMATVHAIEIPRGAKVLDSCSAPGGKTTQLASLVGKSGVVVANEYEAKRCRILQGNVERMGCVNTVVVNLDTAVLAETYPAEFDVVLCDAPCSGEGMFRKNSLAVDEWSEENVEMCAERQREILTNVEKCVAAQGFLIYSTCTFSLEENEQVIHEFLCDNPEFILCEVKDCLKAKTADGISYLGAETDYLKKARRFYPHISPGEGQFVALIKRMGDKPAEITFKDASTPPDRQAAGIIAQFLKSTLAAPPRAEVRKYGENYYLISHGLPIPKNSVFSAGVLIGEIRKGILTPSHQFFTCYGGDFIRKIEPSDEEVMRYLAGEELAYDGDLTTGFCAIIYRGAPIGGGKIAGGRIKNHYPKGLRNR
jgi:NOL1/NOP2/sun family putative RNA methylase